MSTTKEKLKKLKKKRDDINSQIYKLERPARKRVENKQKEFAAMVKLYNQYRHVMSIFGVLLIAIWLYMILNLGLITTPIHMMIIDIPKMKMCQNGQKKNSANGFYVNFDKITKHKYKSVKDLAERLRKAYGEPKGSGVYGES